MKCDLCNNKASVFLTQIIKDQMTTVNLCEKCSKQKGVTDTTGFSLAEEFLGPVSARADELSCPACGFTQSQLKKIGRMGCPECYTTFRDGLENLLAAMHKGTSHVGKVPGKSSVKFPERKAPPAPKLQEVDKKKLIESLRTKLEAAVSEERYEDAAQLKRQINELSNKS
ncbi:MAG: UvrB/UvrC motif-containing protein [Verrucomicrobiaceae bacterium]|nr:UvrB/UvrC motif-containing protein [Verrucomicrobiaceae bacterium]